MYSENRKVNDMCARIDATATARNFAVDYMKKNPKASKDQLQAAVRWHLQELTSQGEKISKKAMNAAVIDAVTVYDIPSEKIKANFTPIKNKNLDEAKKYFKEKTAADRYYYEQNQMGNLARKRKTSEQRNIVKDAFTSDDYLEVLKRNNPSEYEKEIALRNAPKPKSNNANKKEANADYQSSKKRKLAKKQAEIQSQQKHKAYRSTKMSRNAEYLTSQGMMTKEGKKLYQKIKSHQIIADAPWKSAQESAKVFMENGFAPIIESDGKQLEPVSDVVETVVNDTASEVKTIVSDAAENVKTAAGNAGKKASKGKWGWIAAGVGILGGAIGVKSYSDNKKSQEIRLSA